MRYFLIGFMGCGKTYWAKQWGETFQLKYFDLDEEIEKREGKTISNIFKEKGEDYFRKIESHALKTYMHLDEVIIACGGGTPCFFNNMQWMNKMGITIYLISSPGELAERLRKEKEARPLITDVPDDVMETFIEQRLKQREPWYLQSMYHLHTRYLTNDNFEKIRRVNAK